MFGLFLALWGYTVLFVFCRPFGAFIIQICARLRFTDPMIKVVIGGPILSFAILSTAAVCLHLAVVLLPQLRQRFRPTALGHLAILTLLFMAFAFGHTVCTKRFPYF